MKTYINIILINENIHGYFTDVPFLYLPTENLSSAKYSQIRNFGYKTNANINPLMNKVYV